MSNLTNRRFKMRDKRFVAEHRGGPLKKEQHFQLIIWACDCAEHVMPLYGKKIDERLVTALEVAKAWTKGKASVGDARKASSGAHAAARESSNSTSVALARSVGHAVATAHMADHAPGAAEYALKAIAIKDRDINAERKWQDDQLPSEIKNLVISARKKKSKFWKKHFQNIKNSNELG
jgi:hypothetical protein